MIDSGLIARIIAEPNDDLPRLQAADWLDGHGEPERAEFIRVQCDLAEGPRQYRQCWENQPHIDAEVTRLVSLHRRQQELFAAVTFNELPTRMTGWYLEIETVASQQAALGVRSPSGWELLGTRDPQYGEELFLHCPECVRRDHISVVRQDIAALSRLNSRTTVRLVLWEFSVTPKRMYGTFVGQCERCRRAFLTRPTSDMMAEQ